MEIRQYRFFRHSLAIAISCFSLLAPQYVLSQPQMKAYSHKENYKKFTPGKTQNRVQSKATQNNVVAAAQDPLIDDSIEKEFVFPSFNESLLRHPTKQARYHKLYKKISTDPGILELRQAKRAFAILYEKNVSFFTVDEDAPVRIPKIVHQIWLGGNVPEKFIFWMSTWANMQGWEYKLWTDSDVAEFPLHNRQLYENAKDYGEKADILRYEILFNEGGLYVDVDFENLNTQLFDQLHQSFDFYAGLEPMEHKQPINSPLVGNAILASVPGHPILKKVVLGMDTHYKKDETQWAVVTTGPVYLTKTINKYIQNPDKKYRNIILPPTFFFPLTYSEVRNDLEGNLIKFIKPETASIHYWSGSWILEEDDDAEESVEREKVGLQEISIIKNPNKKRWIH